MSDDEPVEEVAADGTVVRVVTRARMRAERLRHRCVYIAVVGTDGRLLVHQRAGWKDVWPDRWDVAFGGVCAAGEAWLDAARRELAEESGLSGVALEALAADPVPYDDDEVHTLGTVWKAVSDGPFRFPDGEVVATAWVAPADLAAWLAGHATCPDSVALVLPVLGLGHPPADA